MHQLNKIINQLQILKNNLSEGKNTEARAIFALLRGDRIDLRKTMKGVEKEILLTALELEGYHQSNAAARLGVTEANFRYTIKKHGIERGRLHKAKERQRRSRSRIAKVT